MITCRGYDNGHNHLVYNEPTDMGAWPNTAIPAQGRMWLPAGKTWVGKSGQNFRGEFPWHGHGQDKG